MITKISIKNFKRFEDVEIDLGSAVVFIGPNDSGKTTALQALTLWSIGLRQWNVKRKGEEVPKKRSGVTINRSDLLTVPTPAAKLLWRDLHVREAKKVDSGTQNVLIEIIVEGITEDKSWKCGLEFDFANEESFYCKPLRLSNGESSPRMPIPDEAGKVQVAFLPPMSGLSLSETLLQQGAINLLIGQGRTAEVLRNLCYKASDEKAESWKKIVKYIEKLFGIVLDNPQYIAERGEIVMTYQTKNNVRLDISSSGRGLQQTLLFLSYMYSNPNSVLLLDEPDAHLEILRQRQIYEILTKVAQEQNSQIIAASHSEVILNEAADRDLVIAFVGKPHCISDRGRQLVKSLKEIGFDQYYQAEETGWVLYLEGSTDLAILKTFAGTLAHEAVNFLERPFVHYIANQPAKARGHFYGLQEAKQDLVGIIIVDNLTEQLHEVDLLKELMWSKKEIENYLCFREVLIKYAESIVSDNEFGPLFARAESEKRKKIMEECINDFIPPVALKNRDDRWWNEVKATDDFLNRLFEAYFKKLGLPNIMKKTSYHILAGLVPKGMIDKEVIEKLDMIVEVAKKAKPLES